MRSRFILTAIIILFFLNATNAQSHISTGKYACQLVPASWNTEKYTCPACAKIAAAKTAAKVIEDKKKAEASAAKLKADRIANQKDFEAQKLKNKEAQKVTEVSIAMPATGSDNVTTDVQSQPTYAPTLNYTPSLTPSTAKAQRDQAKVEAITQVTGMVGGFLDDWNARREKKWADEEAGKMREKEAKQDRFNAIYMPMMDQAKKGNDQARMILYFASEHLESTYSLPDREKWLQEAYKNKNIYAILEMSNKLIDKGGIELLEMAATAGNVDAMVKLANWYDSKTRRAWMYDYVGGENPKLALEWYTKAAEKGSPVAMYCLGMIYKYGATMDAGGDYGFSRKVHVKYDVPLNEKTSFEWFSKSIQPNYRESIFTIQKEWWTTYNDWRLTFRTSKASFFNHYAYKELALFYNDGKVVPKDKQKAKDLQNSFKTYNSGNLNMF